MKFLMQRLVFLCFGLGFALKPASSKGTEGIPDAVTSLWHSLREKVVSLYPNEESDKIIRKLESAKDPQDFYRSFAPYYYRLFRDEPKLIGSLQSLLDGKGRCVGDAHLENFGTILQKSGKLTFTVNDPDDAGECPLIADAVRLLVGIQLAQLDKDFPNNWRSNWWSAYRAGLTASERPSSAVLDEWVRKMAKSDSSLPKKFLDASAKSKGVDRIARDQKGVSEVSEALKAKLILAFSGLKYSSARKDRILDVVEYRKSGGGSGGLLRYWFLLKGADHSLRWSEWKELRAPAVTAYSSSSEAVRPRTVEEVRSLLEWEHGGEVHPAFDVQAFNGKVFFVRPKLKSMDGIGFKNIMPKDIERILQIEAWTLGSLHRKGIPATQLTFSERLVAVKEEQLASAANNLVQKISADFKILKSDSGKRN